MNIQIYKNREFNNLTLVVYKGQLTVLYNFLTEIDPSFKYVMKEIKLGLRNDKLLSMDSVNFHEKYQHVEDLYLGEGNSE